MKKKELSEWETHLCGNKIGQVFRYLPLSNMSCWVWGKEGNFAGQMCSVCFGRAEREWRIEQEEGEVKKER